MTETRQKGRKEERKKEGMKEGKTEGKKEQRINLIFFAMDLFTNTDDINCCNKFSAWHSEFD